MCELPHPHWMLRARVASERLQEDVATDGDGRRFIERGEELGEWSLLVDAEGEVVAVRTVPYDGQLVFSTEIRPNRRDKNSEYQLHVVEVVRRYAERSDTDRPVPELLEDVEAARRDVLGGDASAEDTES